LKTARTWRYYTIMTALTSVQISLVFRSRNCSATHLRNATISFGSTAPHSGLRAAESGSNADQRR
jgi:hypothetical protein